MSNLQSSGTTLLHSHSLVLKISMMFNNSIWNYTDPEVLCLKITVSELIICPKLTKIKSQNVLNLLIMDVG